MQIATCPGSYYFGYGVIDSKSCRLVSSLFCLGSEAEETGRYVQMKGIFYENGEQYSKYLSFAQS